MQWSHMIIIDHMIIGGDHTMGSCDYRRGNAMGSCGHNGSHDQVVMQWGHAIVTDHVIPPSNIRRGQGTPSNIRKGSGDTLKYQKGSQVKWLFIYLIGLQSEEVQQTTACNMCLFM